MIDDNIKIKFGAAVIKTLTEFARTGIPDPAKMDANWFEHIQDKTIREAVCDTFYGARWHYKTGLALLVEKKEQYAHVRAQVIDYSRTHYSTGRCAIKPRSACYFERSAPYCRMQSLD